MNLLRLLPAGLACVIAAMAQAPRPNIIFIMADDLGYGEIGCYGQRKIETPNIDRLAAEGMKFTQFYAGSTVCAPSRSVLMTGLHMGHTRVRGNIGGLAQSLMAEDVTVARVLQQAGYRTGIVGKWGLGDANEPGAPWRQGFDYNYGFLDQSHAHNYYPSFLYRNREKVPLPNVVVHVGPSEDSGYATKRIAYVGDLFAQEARDFIERNRTRPFFLYLPLTAPHGNNERAVALGDGHEVPELGPYANKPWKLTEKEHAAMITRMDADIGTLMSQLQQLGLDARTLVIFTSDNGPHHEGGPQYNAAFFDVGGPLRGMKRDLYEGGIRVPFIARWPGKIKAGSESGFVGYFGDMMATLSALTETKPPPHLDSISILPTLTGSGTQAQHEYLYWEFYEHGISQAVLLAGHWKGLKPKEPSSALELYDLATDLGEQHDIAAQHPDVVSRIRAIMPGAHIDNRYWRIPPPLETR